MNLKDFGRILTRSFKSGDPNLERRLDDSPFSRALIITYFVTAPAQAIGYSLLATYGEHPEALLIPVGTNIYYYLRNRYKDMQQNIRKT